MQKSQPPHKHIVQKPLANFANKNPKKETTQIVDFWGFFVYIVIIRLVLFHCRLYIGHCLPNSSLPIEELFLRAVLYRGGNYDCQVQRNKIVIL